MSTPVQSLGKSRGVRWLLWGALACIVAGIAAFLVLGVGQVRQASRRVEVI